ncbi:MAG: hypothetical protein E7665_04945 [Ruminococcaceae bacterium]|nr:hypothetical protein [Oscillospiraceae bacterium]
MLSCLWGGYALGNVVFDENTESETIRHPIAEPPSLESHPAYFFETDTALYPEILTSNWYPDTEYVKKMLESAMEGADKLNAENVYYYVNSAYGSLASYSNYLKYMDTLSITKGDTIYGAYTKEGVPTFGGGVGYPDIHTTGDYIVRSYTELLDACKKASSGEVIFIPSDVSIDLTMEIKDADNKGYYVYLNEGVTLASDRGYVREDGTVSTGAKLYGCGIDTPSITTGFVYCNKDARITGITLQGPDGNRHLEHHYRSFSVINAPGHDYYYRFPIAGGVSILGDNVEIDNCELSGFSSYAIGVSAYECYIHHNYIHHNQINGLGYGVSFGHGGGLIEYNLFNYNRHSIAGSGYGDSYYTARYNVDMGESLDHVYDMHGGADRKDGTNIAGKYVEMYNNTFLTASRPFHIRGVPVEYYTFCHNILLNPVNQYNYGVLTGEKMKIYDNIFGIEKQTVVK